MNEMEPQLINFNGWIARLQPAQEKPERVLVLIHGWKGDENSMWMLARNLSGHYYIIAPRGFFPVSDGGYSWREIEPGTWGKASLEDLRPLAEKLLEFLDQWSQSNGIQATSFDLIGFSQGAAMAIAFLLLHPERVGRVVALSGFLPEEKVRTLKIPVLSGKSVFISHGKKDKLISIENSRIVAEVLRKAGADVSYSESETGHKVDRRCLGEMQEFLNWN